MLTRVNQIGLVKTAIMTKKRRTTKKSIIQIITGPSTTTKSINAITAKTKNIPKIGTSVKVVKAERIATAPRTIPYQKVFQIFAVHPHRTQEIGFKKFKIHPKGPKIKFNGK